MLSSTIFILHVAGWKSYTKGSFKIQNPGGKILSQKKNFTTHSASNWISLHVIRVRRKIFQRTRLQIGFLSMSSGFIEKFYNTLGSNGFLSESSGFVEIFFHALGFNWNSLKFLAPRRANRPVGHRAPRRANRPVGHRAPRRANRPVGHERPLKPFHIVDYRSLYNRHQLRGHVDTTIYYVHITLMETTLHHIGP